MIDFDIHIHLKLNDDSKDKNIAVVNNFYFHINQNEVKSTIDLITDSSDDDLTNMEGFTAIEKGGNLEYELNFNGVDQDMKTNIIKYLEEIDNKPLQKTGGRRNKRTKKRKTKRRKVSNKKKSRTNKKTRR